MNRVIKKTQDLTVEILRRARGRVPVATRARLGNLISPEGFWEKQALSHRQLESQQQITSLKFWIAEGEKERGMLASRLLEAEQERNKLVAELMAAQPQITSLEEKLEVKQLNFFIQPHPGDREHVMSNRKWLAHLFLKGKGIEIGALHQPLEVPAWVEVKYVDRMFEDELRKHYPELASENLVKVEIIDDGEKLATFEENSLDFVIANHIVEHYQDPIGSICNMLRVLKEGGVLYLAVPDKNYTFDYNRPLTTLEHVVRDNEEGPTWSKRQHFEEVTRLHWARITNTVEEEAIQRQLNHFLQIDYSIHYHVWSQAEMFELMVALKRRISFPFEIEIFIKNGDEMVFILTKGKGHPYNQG